MVLSIIIPVYNSAHFIRECLDSCLSQNIPSNEYEIICVNDGSTDDSLKILNDYSSRHSNITIIDVENGGVSKARNIGIERASGLYIWFIDSDDLITENVLFELKDLMYTRKFDRIKILSHCFNTVLTKDELQKYKEKSLCANYPHKHSQITRTLLKKEYIDSHQIRFYEGLKYGEDTLFSFETRLYKPKDLWFKNTVVYLYRLHENATTNVTNDSKRRIYIDSCYQAINIVKNYYYNGPHRESAKMLCYWIETMLGQYVNSLELKNQFCWPEDTLVVKPFDFKLRRLNNICINTSTTHDFKECSEYIKKQHNKSIQNQEKKIRVKTIKGYIRHPKRLVKIFKNNKE